MSITLTIKQVAGKPFTVSVHEVNSTVADVKTAIALAREDLPTDIIRLFLDDMDLPNETILKNANIKDGSELKLLRDEGSDSCPDSEAEEGEDDDSFIVGDDVIEEDEDEEEEEVVEEVVDGEAAAAVAASDEAQLTTAKIAARKKKRPLVDIDPEANIIDQPRKRRPTVRFVHPDLAAAILNESVIQLTEEDKAAVDREVKSDDEDDEYQYDEEEEVGSEEDEEEDIDEVDEDEEEEWV
jgi:hypothetical protein